MIHVMVGNGSQRRVSLLIYLLEGKSASAVSTCRYWTVPQTNCSNRTVTWLFFFVFLRLADAVLRTADESSDQPCSISALALCRCDRYLPYIPGQLLAS